MSRLKGSRLLLFNIVTSGAAYAGGDQIQQRFEGRGRETATNWRRSGHMTGVGAPIGFMSHYWYILLDRVLPGISGRAVTRKVLADMIIFAPVCLTTFFVGRLSNGITIIWCGLAGIGLMEGKSSREIAVDMKTFLPVAYVVRKISLLNH